MSETRVTNTTNESAATFQPPLEREQTSSAYSPLSSTEKLDRVAKKQAKCISKWFPFLNQWGLEITALALSLVAFGVMIYLLYQSAGEPISKWTKTYISLNTTVSILAGTSRACLEFSISMCLSQGKWNWLARSAQPLVDFDRFDAASRGAWGSLRLLQSCVRRPHWISMGALTAIALLAFEPFTQAVLAIEDKQVTLSHTEYEKLLLSTNSSLIPVENGPVIGRSRLLNGASWSGFVGGVALVPFPGPNNTTLNLTVDRHSSNVQEDMGMKAAMWTGFSPFTVAQNLRPALACATANCTWANFTSIAVCSKCQDISRYVVKSSGPVKFPTQMQYMWPAGQSWVLGPGDSLPDVSNPSPSFDWNNGKNFTFIKHKIPELDLSISNYNGTRQCQHQNQPCPDTYLSARVTTNPGQTLSFRNFSTMIIAIQYLAANESWFQNGTTWEDTRVAAQECALSLCVNEYYDEVSQGVLRQSVVSFWMDRETGSYTSNRTNLKAFERYTNHSLDMGIMFSKLSDLQIKVPDKDFNRQASALPSVMQHQYFNITQPTIIAMHNILSDGFGDIRGSHNTENPDKNYSGITSKKLIYPALGMGLPTAGFMSGLGESSHVPSMLDNVALSLTKWIRDRELEGLRMVGNATRMDIITRVRWNYLWFPGTSLITGIIFAILCMWETQKLKKPALKDSILAALACAPDEDMRLCLKEAVANDKLREVGRRLEVRWEEDDKFGQLKEKKDDQPSV